MHETILGLAQMVAGAREWEMPLLETLCRVAESGWAHRLREGVTPEDCGSAFPCAAAFTAAEYLNIGRSGAAAEDFKAGDISVEGRSAADSAALAQSLRLAAERLMAPYAVEAEFAFRRVQG